MNDQPWKEYTAALDSVGKARDLAVRRREELLRQQQDTVGSAKRWIEEANRARDRLGTRVNELARDASATLDQHGVPLEGPAAEISVTTQSTVEDAMRTADRLTQDLREAGEELEHARERAKNTRAWQVRALLAAVLAIAGGVLTVMVGGSYTEALVTAALGAGIVALLRWRRRSFRRAMAFAGGAVLSLVVILSIVGSYAVSLAILAVIGIVVYFWLLRK